eukprot:comp24624_c0_seq1/m.60556 comp24624_c0_seq1/g.60556  ORF comp24624_c0_seq1/g.60556 comp24624_c0_seq1/m.60556 type:complete len:377 (+) comp24624_c0_seq1:3-1133(+)
MSEVLGVLSGIGVGILFDKATVDEANVFRAQGKLRNHAPLRTFWGAAATGSLSFACLWPHSPCPSSGSVRDSLMQSGIGGALMGSGMYVSGSCPGTLLSQIGAGMPEVPWVLPGALCGAAAYGLVEQHLPALLPRSWRPETLPELFGTPTWPVALGFAGLITGVLVMLEKVNPWVLEGIDEEDLFLTKVFTPLSIRLSHKSWPTHFVGPMIGLLHIPSFLKHGVGLGFTDGFLIFPALLFRQLGIPLSASFQSVLQPENLRWSVLIDIGVIVGAYISARQSGKLIANRRRAHVRRFSWSERAWLFFGGFCTLFGARLTNGCVSGTSLTGFFKLNTGTCLAVTTLTFSGLIAAWLSQFIPGTRSLRYRKESRPLDAD